MREKIIIGALIVLFGILVRLVFIDFTISGASIADFFKITFLDVSIAYFFETLQPLATIMIGAIVAMIAIYNYHEIRNTRFEFSYTVHYNNYVPKRVFPSGIAFPINEITPETSLTSYIDKIIIYNCKNRTEIIKGIFIKMSNGKILELINDKKQSMLISPYNILEIKLNPVTNYYSKFDGRGYIFNYNRIFYNDTKMVSIKNEYTFKKELELFEWLWKNNCELFFEDKRNKLIIETNKGFYSTGRNKKTKKSNVETSKILYPMRRKSYFGNVVDANVHSIEYIEIEKKHINKFRLRIDNNIARKEYKKLKQIISETENFELQITKFQSGYFYVSAVLVSKNGEKRFIPTTLESGFKSLSYDSSNPHELIFNRLIKKVNTIEKTKIFHKSVHVMYCQHPKIDQCGIIDEDYDPSYRSWRERFVQDWFQSPFPPHTTAGEQR